MDSVLSVGGTACLQRPSLADGLDQCRGVQLDSEVFVLVYVHVLRRIKCFAVYRLRVLRLQMRIL